MKRALAVLLALTLLPGQTKGMLAHGAQNRLRALVHVLAALAVRAGTQPKLRQLKTGVREECVADVFLYTDSLAGSGRMRFNSFSNAAGTGASGSQSQRRT